MKWEHKHGTAKTQMAFRKVTGVIRGHRGWLQECETRAVSLCHLLREHGWMLHCRGLKIHYYFWIKVPAFSLCTGPCRFCSFSWEIRVHCIEESSNYSCNGLFSWKKIPKYTFKVSILVKPAQRIVPMLFCTFEIFYNNWRGIYVYTVYLHDEILCRRQKKAIWKMYGKNVKY